MNRLRGRSIAVFGSSEPVETDPLYAVAREVGRLLGREGARVVTGGYGGVMEAACRGARESGAATHGVVCDVFSHRSPNPYLDGVTRSTDLYERTRKLIDLADGFVILDGQSGTLAELAFLWALDRAGCLPNNRVVLFGDAWRRVWPTLEQAGVAGAAQRAFTTIANSPADVVERIVRSIERRR